MPAGSRWVAFTLAHDRSDEVALSAAADDINTQRHEAIGDAAPALAVKLVVDVAGRQLVVWVAGGNGTGNSEGQVVSLTRAVIQRSADEGIPPLALLASALAAPAPLDEAWRPRRVGTSSAPTEKALVQHHRIYRLTSADRRIEQALQDGRDVVLMGDYGSGKTATATIHAQRCAGNGYGVIWLDLTDPADGPESVLAVLLARPLHDRYLVLADSVQANPAAFEEVLACVRRLRPTFGLTIQILATSWPRLVHGWREPFKEFQRVSAQNLDMIYQFVAESRVPGNARNQILQLAAGDVHVAVDAVDYYGCYGRVPTWLDLQSEITQGIDDDECRRALYYLASLGLFGLDASRHTATGWLPDSVVTRLVGDNLVTHTDGRYAIPSHARARLTLDQALVSWDAANRWGPPEQLVWEHLQRAGERLIKATLGRLDLVGLSGDPSRQPFNASTRYLARAWDMFEQLGRTLALRCREDETWGDNVGAAIFAARALLVMDQREPWLQVATFVRRRWTYDQPGVLPAPVGRPSSESADFDKILSAMRQEDLRTPDAPHVRADPADTIDMDRFYATWMLGALIGFEGIATDRGSDRLDALLATAEREIAPQGYFYPRRVPWVTARNVLGLCLAGESYHSSWVVRRACDHGHVPHRAAARWRSDDRDHHSPTLAVGSREAVVAAWPGGRPRTRPRGRPARRRPPEGLPAGARPPGMGAERAHLPYPTHVWSRTGGRPAGAVCRRTARFLRLGDSHPRVQGSSPRDDPPRQPASAHQRLLAAAGTYSATLARR